MASSDRDKVKELGVTVKLPETRTTAEKLKIYNPALASVREAVLCTLQLQCEGREDVLQCLDAVSNTGLACMQWKKSLRDLIHVVASEPDSHGFHRNCELNDQQPVDWPIGDIHRPGELPKCQQSEKEIYVCPQNGNIALHKDAFSFVYLQPNGTISSYIDSLFTSLRHNGVACIVSPDVSSQCVRSSHLIQKQFHSHVIKTDYLKEMAARVVIGACARAAARYNKGLEVLYTIGTADHLLIAVRMIRRLGEQNMKACQHVMHCLMCEERVVHPDTHTVIESPYNLLPCDCKSTNPGRTAVLLGPMWCGSIFSVSYLEKLKLQVQKNLPNSKLNNLIETVLAEAKCERMQISRESSRQDLPSVDQIIVKDLLTNEMKGHDTYEPIRKKQKLENGEKFSDATNDQQNKSSENGFNKCGSESDSSVKSPMSDTNRTGRNKLSSNGNDDAPLFYHDLHRKKFHAENLPKSDKLVTMLRSQGFRASRTHFEPTAVRTNATVKQMMQVMNREPVKR